MSHTTDPNDPRLGHGADTEKTPQNEAYLVLPEEERAKGFLRPVRYAYKHIGRIKDPVTRELTADEHERYDKYGYIAYEEYPQTTESAVVGRYWTQADLDNKGCGAVTSMTQPLAETYARFPTFYGSTYCCGCQKHLPVTGFIWEADGQVVGS